MKKIYFIIFSFILCLFSLSIVSSQEIEGLKPYRIAKGDTLWKIAPEKHWEIIKKVNRIDEKHLILGKTIFIPNNLAKALRFCPVPKNLIKAEDFNRILCVFLDIQYFGAYEKGKLLFWGPISSGKKGHETPKGKYKAIWKAKEYSSKKHNNSPMPYSINYSCAGHFIHQQSLPGRPASHGCVRLLMRDAKKIFYWVKIGDPIEIKNFDSP